MYFIWCTATAAYLFMYMNVSKYWISFLYISFKSKLRIYTYMFCTYKNSNNNTNKQEKSIKSGALHLLIDYGVYGWLCAVCVR